MKEESIPPRSLEEEGVLKDLRVASSLSAPTATYKSTPYCMSIGFSDEDLLLGSKLHNRPLYVSGYVREQRVDRILIDNGSAVNIMPKSTMRQLGILMNELSNSKLVIQGFNQGSQRVIRMIRLELIIGDLKARALFYVIDLRTTYKLLLGRPWIHENRVVTSTLHQCFKFYQEDVKKVEADSNPFSEAESHFADAKFYLKNDNNPEAVLVEISLVNREDNLQLKSLTRREPHKSIGSFNSGKGEASTSTTKKSTQGLNVGDIEVLKESFTTPLAKITKQEIKIDLTEVMDFTTHIEFKSLKIHEQSELSSIQKKLLRKGHAILVSRKGLGYKSLEPTCITRNGKEKVVDSNHITVEEVDSWKKKKASTTTRPSAFERLSVAKKKNVLTPHAPIFDCIGEGGLHVKTDSSIDTKKKEPTSHVSTWRQIKHTDVENYHGKVFPCEVKRHDVILTNPQKEDLRQEEDETSCHHITILEELEIETPEEDAKDVPKSLKNGVQSIVDELKEVNLNTIEKPRPTFIGASLFSEEKGKYMSLLTEYKDIFAWSYKEILGLDPKVSVYHLKMPRPKSSHDLRSLQEQLAYIRRFISNLAGGCQPFQKLMRKGKKFVWDETCQNAFDSIKKYLLNPSILGALVLGKPLILYVTTQERSLGALLAQEEEKEKTRALYYLSRILVGAEVNYSPIEKMCLALFFAIDKLRHYMQAFTVHLVAKVDSIKTSTGKLSSRPPNSFRLEVMEDLPGDEVFFTEVMEPWTMYFDGATRRSGWGQASSSFLLRNICCLITLRFLDCAQTMWLNIRTFLYPCSNRLVLKVGRGPLREAKKENVANFIRTHIIYRYGVTRYSLVYGVEVVLPLEREILSLRMVVQEELTTEDNAKLCLQELEALDEKRLEAQRALKCYQRECLKLLISTLNLAPLRLVI
ncbi:uncharacterized protein E5676_scaffold45G001150 [Cucumis melo var. makuwa]|uniref:Reverse transcriptase/retrotransposon-derived protein RNase H-like domain-containing protein n=1 Tax=Cucumis melo var. makuwa TaxID=1194695 RepID=A0A5D3CU64_CUCMM|nr:uncharacterized protein E5676_scaffold45G001150 [Cucumis melo var. makuwa]